MNTGTCAFAQWLWDSGEVFLSGGSPEDCAEAHGDICGLTIGLAIGPFFDDCVITDEEADVIRTVLREVLCN